MKNITWGAILFCVSWAGAQEWEIEAIATGTKPELAVDSNNRPHIAFMIEDFSGGLYYALKDGGQWHIEQPFEGYFYGPLDIALGLDEEPHIVYHDHSAPNNIDEGDAVYLFKEGDVWQSETIRHSGHDGWDASLAIGQEGEVHIASIEPVQFGGQDGIEWGVRVGDRWNVASIGSGPIPYEFGTDIVIDPEGLPHLVYHDGTERLTLGSGADLFYASYNGSWEIQTVEAEGDVGKFASLAMDASGRPHIAYFDWTELNAARVKYAVWDDDEWLIEVVDELPNIQVAFIGARRTMSLALDVQGQPHIAYCSRDVLKYSIKKGDAWEIQEVTRAGSDELELGQLVSLALDSTGRPHLSFFEVPANPRSSTGTVLYAVGPVPTAVAETAQTEPEDSALGQNFPNPFNAETIIQYRLERPAEATVEVVNLVGQRVRRLLVGWQVAGSYQVTWDGLDDQGRALASGVYFSRLQAGDFIGMRKMVLLR